MASSKNRQRALARAKAERQIARRALAARKRRRWQAGGVAITTIAAVGLVGAWAGGAFDPEPRTPDVCAWTPNENDANVDLQDVGTPPTRGIPKSGFKTMTIELGKGTVEVEMDLSKVPCSAASLSYLAEKKFFNSTTCHRLVNGSFFALQCGDPKASGLGGPKYYSVDENLPVNAQSEASPSPQVADSAMSATSATSATPTSTTAPAEADPSASPSAVSNTYLYPRGTVAFSNNGPNTNGSQFYIFFKDSPDVPSEFSIIGTVVKGIEVVEGIGAVGVADKDGAAQTDGAPKEEVAVTTLTVGSVRKTAIAASASASVPATDPNAATPSADAVPSAPASS